MIFYYSMEMPFDEFALKLPLYSHLVNEKNPSFYFNLNKESLEKLDEKEKTFFTQYLSGVSFNRYSSPKSLVENEFHDNHSWVNFNLGKLSLFNAHISGNSKMVLMTIRIGFDSLKIYNAAHSKIKSLKDLIGKYMRCSFDESDMNRVLSVNLEIQSGIPLTQKMEVNFSNKDFKDKSLRYLITRINLSHFKNKYEGP